MSNSTFAHTPAIAHLPVQKIKASSRQETDDSVAVEEPLEIRLLYGPAGRRIEQGISITMRTPGHDPELAIGFLFTEGIIPDASAIVSIDQEDPNSNGAAPTSPNSICIGLQEQVILDLGRLQRHFYTSSSCGVCGKSSIDALRTVCPIAGPEEDGQISPELLYSLPSLLRQEQDIFDSTGGLHASALFDRKGNLLSLREDIGRHNALDKLIGHALHEGLLPLHSHILVLSGRACFELIQKAAMAGIRIVAAVGPPSSLAVQLAEEQGMTLVGFLRQERFNIYSGAHRIRV
jgi:FdhD protein